MAEWFPGRTKVFDEMVSQSVSSLPSYRIAVCEQGLSISTKIRNQSHSLRLNRFIKDIEMMIGERTWLFWLWWRACWFLISPSLLVMILVWSSVTFAPPTYGPVKYPVWAVVLGWCMTIFCIMWIPIVAVVRFVQGEGSTLWQGYAWILLLTCPNVVCITTGFLPVLVGIGRLLSSLFLSFN